MILQVRIISTALVKSLAIPSRWNNMRASRAQLTAVMSSKLSLCTNNKPPVPQSSGAPSQETHKAASSESATDGATTPSASQTNHSSTSPQSTVQTIFQSTQHAWNQSWNKAYSDMETTIMERIHESNRQRFRIMLFGIPVVSVWLIAVFGGDVKKMLTRQTADIAKETLENKSLQIQTHELATAVVQTVLNDKEVTIRAANFIREAISTPETRDAMLALINQLLQHPETKAALTTLSKYVINDLSSDKVDA